MPLENVHPQLTAISWVSDSVYSANETPDKTCVSKKKQKKLTTLVSAILTVITQKKISQKVFLNSFKYR